MAKLLDNALNNYMILEGDSFDLQYQNLIEKMKTITLENKYTSHTKLY